MPIFDYKCSKCGEEVEHLMTKAPDSVSIHEYCQKCDEVTQQVRQVSRRTGIRGNFR
jgi:putative FmdB family regulatory protein